MALNQEPGSTLTAPNPMMMAGAAEGPAALDPYQNHDAILDLVNRKVKEWSKGRELILRADWRNILFWRGIQWIRFERTTNRFRPAFLPKNWPTPVTNRFASSMDSLIALIARIEPRLKFPPATDDPEDRATGDVSDRVTPVIEAETGIRQTRQYLATWVGLTGGAWVETGSDRAPRHGMVTGETGEPDPMTGQPVTQQMPRGKMYAEVVPKFEMWFDPSITDWDKQREHCRRRGIPEDEAKARWPAVAAKIQPDSMSSEMEMYGDALPTLGPNIDDARNPRNALSAPHTNTRVTEQWFHQLPSETYPGGLLAIVLGRELVAYAGPLPYKARQEDGSELPILNHIFFPMKLVPGSAWPKTVADDVALKQIQRNQIEALEQLILMRMANPVWLVPSGANVRNPTGEPGQWIEYNALGPNPAKPGRFPGQNVPASVYRKMEQIDKDIEELTANYDVLKGDRPPGVSAGITLQLLQERGMSRHAPMFIMWETAWAKWGRLALEIFRQFATEPLLHQIQGKDVRWQF